MGEVLNLRIDPEWEEIETVRQACSDFLAAKEFSDEAVHALTMVVSELTENDIKYGSFSVNSVIRKNISRLGSDHYMTMMAIRFDPEQLVVAGKHQDIIIYRSALNQTRVIPTKGTWLGIADDIHGYLNNQAITVEKGDIILLYTDGVTEATSITGEMYGQNRLERSLSQYADLPISRIRDKIIEDVTRFQDVQQDDLTLVVIQKK